MGQPFALSKHLCSLLFVLFIQAKTPNRAVENGVFHYPVGPFVLKLQPLGGGQPYLNLFKPIPISPIFTSVLHCFV